MAVINLMKLMPEPFWFSFISAISIYLFKPAIGALYGFYLSPDGFSFSFNSLTCSSFSFKRLSILFSFPPSFSISLSFVFFLNLGPLLRGSRASLKVDKTLSFQRYIDFLSTPASLAIGWVFSPFTTLYITSIFLSTGIGLKLNLDLLSLFNSVYYYQMREKLSRRKMRNNYKKELLHFRED